MSAEEHTIGGENRAVQASELESKVSNLMSEILDEYPFVLDSFMQQDNVEFSAEPFFKWLFTNDLTNQTINISGENLSLLAQYFTGNQFVADNRKLVFDYIKNKQDTSKLFSNLEDFYNVMASFGEDFEVLFINEILAAKPSLVLQLLLRADENDPLTFDQSWFFQQIKYFNDKLDRPLRQLFLSEVILNHPILRNILLSDGNMTRLLYGVYVGERDLYYIIQEESEKFLSNAASSSSAIAASSTGSPTESAASQSNAADVLETLKKEIVTVATYEEVTEVLGKAYSHKLEDEKLIELALHCFMMNKHQAVIDSKQDLLDVCSAIKPDFLEFYNKLDGLIAKFELADPPALKSMREEASNLGLSKNQTASVFSDGLNRSILFTEYEREQLLLELFPEELSSSNNHENKESNQKPSGSSNTYSFFSQPAAQSSNQEKIAPTTISFDENITYEEACREVSSSFYLATPKEWHDALSKTKLDPEAVKELIDLANVLELSNTYDQLNAPFKI